MQDPSDGRPIERGMPLNREQQKRAFEQFRAQYAFGNNGTAPPPPPPPIDIYMKPEPKQPVRQQLQQFEQRLNEYQFVNEVKKIQEEIKETEQKEVIKQFYCAHNFVTTKSTFMGLPIKFKICRKCGMVK